jgi:hypothetical protein
MGKLLHILFIVLIVYIVIIFFGLGYLNVAFPKVSNVPDLIIERTPEFTARGEYLANHINVYMDCHFMPYNEGIRFKCYLQLLPWLR